MSARRPPHRIRLRRGRGWIAALAFVVGGLPALSAAQSPATSRDNDNAPPASPPAREAPAIALVLPLSSATYGRAANAVRAGFIAAADAANERPEVIVHDDGDVLNAFVQARATGARVIVGPLLRDDFKAVAAAGVETPIVLALNQLDEGVALPPNTYALALGVESEARQLARSARDTGALTVAVIGSDAPLQKRFANAFVDAWLLLGGSAPVSLRFDRSPEGLTLLKRELGRTPVDAILLALDTPDAARAKPYVGAVATYAGSMINDRQPREALRDLDDVRFVEIPWLADPDAREFARVPRPEFPNASLDRLYALGLDAFRVAQALADGRSEGIEFDGATGHLSQDGSRQFLRDFRLLQFRGGQVVPDGTR
jgi:outer membrane PBP1 activator LpoA protein